MSSATPISWLPRQMMWRLAGGRSRSAVLVASGSCWYLRSSGSGWRSWSRPRQRGRGGVLRLGVLTQVRSPGKGAPAWMRPGFRCCFSHLFRDAAAAGPGVPAAGIWTSGLARSVSLRGCREDRDGRGRVPTGPLLANPCRVGHLLRDGYAGQYSARRGPNWRVRDRIAEDARSVIVLTSLIAPALTVREQAGPPGAMTRSAGYRRPRTAPVPRRAGLMAHTVMRVPSAVTRLYRAAALA
jgi:hypothetical protein